MTKRKMNAKKCRKMYRGKKLKACLLKIGASKEHREHPWSSRSTARKIARDHLKENPKAYGGRYDDLPGENRRRQEWDEALTKTFRDRVAEQRFFDKLRKRHEAEQWKELEALDEARRGK